MQTRESSLVPARCETVLGTRGQPASGRETALTFAAADGYILGATLFEPEGGEPVRALIAIHGAVAVQQTFYSKLARYFAQAGFAVLTYDYRGIGRSRPESLRGFGATLTDWGTLDAKAALAFAAAIASDKPVFAIGHSFGGQLIGLSDQMRNVAGAVLVAAQLPCLGMFGPITRAYYALAFNVSMPLATAVCGYLPGVLGLGADLPKPATVEWIRWLKSPGYLTDHVPGSRERFAAFDRPVLHFSFTDDELGPVVAIRAMTDALSGAQLEARRIAPAQIGQTAIGHHGFFRSRVAQPLWQDTLQFIERHIADAGTC